MGNRARVVELDGAVEKVLVGYRGYLLCERGLSEATVDCYERRARRFLSGRARLEGLGLDRLTAADVTGFLVRECPLRGAGEAQVLVASVRSVLRYLHVSGLIAVPLEWAVPTVATVGGRSFAAVAGALGGRCAAL